MTSRVERIYSSVNTRVTLANGSGFVFFGADPKFSHRYECIKQKNPDPSFDDQINRVDLKLSFWSGSKILAQVRVYRIKNRIQASTIRYQSGSEIRSLLYCEKSRSILSSRTGTSSVLARVWRWLLNDKSGSNSSIFNRADLLYNQSRSEPRGCQ